MPNSAFVAAAAFLALPLSQVHAQTQPPMPVKWGATSVPVAIHDQMPVVCDQDTTNAATKWNNVYANFIFTDTGNLFYSARVAYGRDPTRVNIEDSDVRANNPYALMQTNRYTSGSTITDADIYVQYDWLYYAGDPSGTNGFYCGDYSASKTDYESTIMHELGHVLGFSDRTDTIECVMKGSIAPGTLRTAPCQDESTKLRSAYGTR